MITPTAAALPHEVERGRAASLFGYITTPFEVKTLPVAVDGAIKAAATRSGRATAVPPAGSEER